MLKKWFGVGKAIAPVPRDVAPEDRIYAIGDVHGRVDLLNGMLKRIALDIAAQEDDREPRIILLGDLIDRGDQSREVLDLVMDVRADLPDGRLQILSGNHEAALLAFLKDPGGRSEWLRFGGLQTLTSYGVQPPKTNASAAEYNAVADQLRAAMGNHLDFLTTFERFIVSGDVVFVHAGLAPNLALEKQDDAAILWGNSGFLDAGGVADWRVVHGHYDAADPVTNPKRICVDTGAYYSGRLTAVRLDAGETMITVDVMDALG